MKMANTLYEKDFYAWTIETAKALKEKAFNRVDIEHLVEELDDMGASQRNELESRLGVLLAHLLKWQFQPSHRGKSWELTIKEQRRKISRRLTKTPSLKSRIEEMLDDAYGDSLLIAQKETGLDEETFPKQCPYTLAQILDESFYP